MLVAKGISEELCDILTRDLMITSVCFLILAYPIKSVYFNWSRALDLTSFLLVNYKTSLMV